MGVRVLWFVAVALCQRVSESAAPQAGEMPTKTIELILTIFLQIP
jgi:hypothetical protein